MMIMPPAFPQAPSRFLEAVGRLSGAASDVYRAAALGSTLGLAASRHVEARAAVQLAWSMVYPNLEPTLEEIQFYQALGAHEGQYGRGWSDRVSPVSGLMTSMQSCNNWGAIQCTNCKPVDGQCCEGCGYWWDSRPTAAGQVQFEQCFKCYATPAEGAAGIMRFLQHYARVLDVIPTGNLDEIAWQMRLGGYYQGFTTDKREAARSYAGALDKYAAEIAAALGEEQVARRKGEGVTGIGGSLLSGAASEEQQAAAIIVAGGLAAGAILAWPTIGPAVAALAGDVVRGLRSAKRAVIG